MAVTQRQRTVVNPGRRKLSAKQIKAGFGGKRFIEPGHGKDAMGRQHIAQHLPVAWFENMQRQQRLRKQHGAGQRHHRDRRREVELHLHAASVSAPEYDATHRPLFRGV